MTRRAHADALIRDAAQHRYDLVPGSGDLRCVTCSAAGVANPHTLTLSAVPRNWRRQTLRDLAALGMLAGDAAAEVASEAGAAPTA